MKKLLLNSILLLCTLIVGTSSSWADPVTIYSETFGDNGNSNTVFGSYSGYSATTAMFVGSGTVASHYSGNGKVGKNSVSPSDTYSGASGLSAAWFTGSKDATTDVLIISGINISGYESLNLSFGMNMTNGASNTNTTTVSYKIDSGEYQTLSYAHPTSFGWGLKSGSISGTGTSLTIKFTMATTGGFTTRYDDIKVTGTTSLTSSAATFGNKAPSINYPTDKTYSQAPNTASGYTGAITYSMTANTAGATIDAESGVVTVTKGGSVTVKATAAAVTGLYTSSEDSYTLTVNDIRASAGLAWSAASANVTYGADNVFPTLTNPHGVAVTYSSTNANAATIDNNGIITLKDKTASTQISAIFAGNDVYKEVSISYTLNVTEAPFTKKDGVFDFVKAANAVPLEDYGSGMTLSTSYTTGDKTWIAGNVKLVTSKVTGNGYRWYTDGTLRFYNKSTATLSVPSGYVITKIVTTGANFNSANVGTLSGSTWRGASNEVELSATATKNIETITVTYTTANQSLTPAKTYTTLTSAYALDFTSVSSDLKAYIATEVSGGAVQMTQVNKVPAGTGLVLKATTPGAAVNVPVFDGTSSDDVSGNKMAGSATATTEIAANAGYILSNGVFQPATAGTLAAGKAYLNIAVSSARELVLDFDDETTGVDDVRSKMSDGRSEYFNLAGQRVAQPTKGLYIVNGRKVVIK